MRLILTCDLIITGEGKVDKQTLMGKVALGVLRLAKKYDKPVVVIGGSVEDKDELVSTGFRGVYCINPDGISLEEVMKHSVAVKNIETTIKMLMNQEYT